MGDNVVETKDGRLIDVRDKLSLKIGRNMKNLLRKEERKKNQERNQKKIRKNLKEKEPKVKNQKHINL